MSKAQCGGAPWFAWKQDGLFFPNSSSGSVSTPSIRNTLKASSQIKSTRVPHCCFIPSSTSCQIDEGGKEQRKTSKGFQSSQEMKYLVRLLLGGTSGRGPPTPVASSGSITCHQYHPRFSLLSSGAPSPLPGSDSRHTLAKWGSQTDCPITPGTDVLGPRFGKAREAGCLPCPGDCHSHGEQPCHPFLHGEWKTVGDLGDGPVLRLGGSQTIQPCLASEPTVCAHDTPVASKHQF